MRWEKVRLGDVCEILNGYAFKSSEYVETDGARIIRITNVQKGTIVDTDPKLYPFDLLNKLKNFEILDGDLLMSLTGNVGRVGIFPKHLCPAYLNQRVCRIIPTEGLSSKYLFHYLNSDFFEQNAINAAGGAAQLNLSTNWLKQHEIPLPPLPIQQHIADILDKADALRRKDQELLKKYDELAQAIFIDMFGDPVKNEKGWEMKPVKSVVSKVSKISKSFREKHIQYIDISSIDNQRFEIAKTTSFSIENRPSRAQQILCKNDVLLSTVRPNLKNIAVNHVDGNIASTGFYVLRAIPDTINPMFLFYIIKSASITSKLEELVSGANYPALKTKDIDDLKLIIPPLALQQSFANKIKLINRLKMSANEEKSEELFQSLLQEVFKE